MLTSFEASAERETSCCKSRHGRLPHRPTVHTSYTSLSHETTAKRETRSQTSLISLNVSYVAVFGFRISEFKFHPELFREPKVTGLPLTYFSSTIFTLHRILLDIICLSDYMHDIAGVILLSSSDTSTTDSIIFQFQC